MINSAATTRMAMTFLRSLRHCRTLQFCIKKGRPARSSLGKVGGGVLELRGQGSLCNLFDLSLVARRWQAFNFDATVKVTSLLRTPLSAVIP